jgi:predicted acylesterase/phospholipase RssA
MKIGIACSAGSYKGVFVHGVLEAFEELSFRADVYASCSSSAVPTAFASTGGLEQLHGVDYWKEAFSRYVKSN